MTAHEWYVRGADRTVLDDKPIVAVEGCFGDPAVAFDGKNYVVAWTEMKDGTNAYGTVVVRPVDRTGKALDISRTNAAGLAPRVRLVAGPSGLLAAWIRCNAGGGAVADDPCETSDLVASTVVGGVLGRPDGTKVLSDVESGASFDSPFGVMADGSGFIVKFAGRAIHVAQDGAVSRDPFTIAHGSAAVKLADGHGLLEVASDGGHLAIRQLYADGQALANDPDPQVPSSQGADDAQATLFAAASNGSGRSLVVYRTYVAEPGAEEGTTPTSPRFAARLVTSQALGDPPSSSSSGGSTTSSSGSTTSSSSSGSSGGGTTHGDDDDGRPLGDGGVDAWTPVEHGPDPGQTDSPDVDAGMPTITVTVTPLHPKGGGCSAAPVSSAPPFTSAFAGIALAFLAHRRRRKAA